MVSEKDAAASYQRYDGAGLQRAELHDAQATTARRDAILAERASVMP